MTPRALPLVAGIVLGAALVPQARGQTSRDWPIHAVDRPQPPVVDPGPGMLPVPPPSDAVVLFDGRSLESWRKADGSPAAWRVVDGAMEVVGGAGSIRTAREFGDCQLHVEWMAPQPARGEGQERGNSGVYLMGLYEVQVLDSWQNPTYADGQAAAIFGQFPPLVNASRQPGQWQSYDIVFRRPRFEATGALHRPARVTVIHNGVVVQDDVVLTGPSAYRARPRYRAHADRLPIVLQDHGQPVRYRNIWIRELPDSVP